MSHLLSSLDNLNIKNINSLLNKKMLLYLTEI